MQPSDVPTLEEAISDYQSSGGFLSPVMPFGCDPLAAHEALIHERERLMEQNLPTPMNLFSYTVNGIDTPLTQAIEFMIEKSFRLQDQI